MHLRLVHLRALLCVLLVSVLLSTLAAVGERSDSIRDGSVCDGQRSVCREAAIDYLDRWEYRWGDSPRDAAGQLVWAGTQDAGAQPTTLDTASWKPLGVTRVPSPPGRNGQRFLWLRTRLSGPDVDDPTLYLDLVNQLFEAYLDGQLIYRFGQLDGSGPDARRFRGYPVHFLRLADRYQGRLLTLRIYSEHINIGIGSQLRLGSKARLIQDTFRRDIGRGMVGSVLCVIGLFVLGLYLAERRERAYLYYGCFALTVGVWLLCQMRSRNLIIDLPLLWTHVEVFALYATAASLALFMAHVFGKGPLGLMPVLAWLLVAYAVGAALLVAVKAVGVMRTLLPFEIMLLLVIGYSVVRVSILVRQGNADGWLFAAGFVVAVLAASYDLLARMGYLPRTDPPVSYLGQGLFVMVVGSILVRRFRQVHLELIEMREKLSEKVRVLETRNVEIGNLNTELRHQIEARSRQLISSLVSAPTPSSSETVQLFDSGALINKRYRVLRMLGQGAMGVVYEVERIHDGRRFAAKVLAGRAGRQALARFAREAQVLARLNHPNLVAIADVEMTESRLAYIIMEFVKGKTLADLSPRYGEVPFALSVLRQLADALAKVHSEGIVHRDLKPANILVAHTAPEEETLIKVADFGVSALLAGDTDSGSASGIAVAAVKQEGAARPQGAPGQEQPSAPDAEESGKRDAASARGSRDNLTQTGVIMGTPLYMAPELVRGAKLAQPAADIFSFGIIAYELLTGHLPADVPPIYLGLKSGKRWFTPLSIRCPTLGEPLASLIESSLDASPTVRPTAATLAAALGGGATPGQDERTRVPAP